MGSWCFLVTLFVAYWVSVHGDPQGCAPEQEFWCRALEAQLGSKVVLFKSAGYNESLGSYWSQQEKEVRPACIVRPTSAEDVAKAITVLTSHQRSKDSRPAGRFAVRGGGHIAWAGAANIEHGVTIDLSLLSSVDVSPDKRTVSIGGGATWGQVYRHIDALDIAVVGGRVSTVGVGGLTLGGGISFFSGRYGFTCDYVESFELVMAGGSVENISATNKPDLFRALKGGTNNFGIVTKFTMYAFPSGNFWGGQIYYNISTKDQQLDALTKLAESDNYDPYAAVIHSYTWQQAIGSIVTTSFTYTQVPASNDTPAFLADMVNIQPSIGETTRVDTLLSFTDELAVVQTDTDSGTFGPRKLFITLSYQNNLAFAKALVEQFERVAKPLIESIPSFSISVSFQPLPQVITSRSQQTGGNVLGFGPEDGSVINLLASASWSDAADDERIESTYKKLFEELNVLAKEMNVFQRAIYLNYASKWQDPIGGYGPEEIAYLRTMSKKYDPKGIFQKYLPGGYKLWTGRGTG